MTDLGIVIVNWNTRGLLERCLQTVFGSEKMSYQVVVVDNASSDGSAEMVSEEFPEAILIANEHNVGFSLANNQGLRKLGFDLGKHDRESPRYALVLNPDTEMPPDAMAAMVEYMDREDRQDVGAASCKLVLPDGNLDPSCRRSFPTPLVSFYRMLGLSKIFPRSPRFGKYNMTYVDPDREIEVDSITGAFMMVRREAMEQVGLFDEGYWMYGEDLDWSFRIKQAGWKIMYTPEVTVLHVKRAASRQNPEARVAFYHAMLKFYRDHYRKTTPLWLHVLVMMGLLVKGGPKAFREPQHDTMDGAQS